MAQIRAGWRRRALCVAVVFVSLRLGVLAVAAAAQAPGAAQPAPTPPASAPGQSGVSAEDQLKARESFAKGMAMEPGQKKVDLLYQAMTLDPLPTYYQAYVEAKAELKRIQDAVKSGEETKSEAGKKQAAAGEAKKSTQAGDVQTLDGDLEAARDSYKSALESAKRADDQTLTATIQKKLDGVDTAIAEQKALRTRLMWGAVAALGLIAALIILVRKTSRRRLEMVEGPERGRVYKLETDLTTIGAVEGDADWVLADPYRKISRRHCQIARSGRHFFLVDCSRNGTFLNGRSVPKGEPVLLRRNDEITIADDVILIFR